MLMCVPDLHTNILIKIVTMILILDGNSEIGAHM